MTTTARRILKLEIGLIETEESRRLTGLFCRAMDVLTPRWSNAMQPGTKFLRLRTPVTIGSLFNDWQVTWLGGWTRDRLSYIVMVARTCADLRERPANACESPMP